MTPTIYLHGALGSAAQFDALREKLPNAPPGFAINLPGHGQTSHEGPFSMEGFEAAVLTFLKAQNFPKVQLVGYSMGGYLALWLAWKHPEIISSVITYGTKLDWTPEVASGMSRMFDPEKIEAKAPQLAESLAHTHGAERWKNLCRQTDAFLQALGQGKGIPFEAFAGIQCPVCIGWGDQDHVVTEAESRRVAEAIPNGRFVSIPGGKHLIEQVEVEVLVDYVVGCGLK